MATFSAFTSTWVRLASSCMNDSFIVTDEGRFPFAIGFIVNQKYENQRGNTLHSSRLLDKQATTVSSKISAWRPRSCPSPSDFGEAKERRQRANFACYNLSSKQRPMTQNMAVLPDSKIQLYISSKSPTSALKYSPICLFWKRQRSSTSHTLNTFFKMTISIASQPVRYLYAPGLSTTRHISITQRASENSRCVHQPIRVVLNCQAPGECQNPSNDCNGFRSA